MDTRFLESFIAVVQSGSFAGAARKLNLTSTAVAQRVRSLEIDLGAVLVMRSGRTVKPTEVGAAVFERAGPFLSQWRDLRSIAHIGTLSGEIHIGAVSTALTGLLPQALVSLTRANPNVEVHIAPGSSAELYQSVLDGKLDAAIIMQPPVVPPKSCDWKLLRTEAMLLVTADEVEVSDIHTCLRTSPFIRYDRMSWGGQQIDSYLREADIRPNERFELDALESIVSLVNRNLGVALVPEWAPPWPEGLTIKRYRIEDARYARRIGVIWARNSVRQTLIQMFVQSLAAGSAPMSGAPNSGSSGPDRNKTK